MCDKVTETIGKSFSEPQLLLVAVQCGKQTEIANLLTCVHQKAIIQSQAGHNQHGVDFSQWSVFSSWSHGNWWHFLAILESVSFPYFHGFSLKLGPFILVILLKHHSTFAELQICALTDDRMKLHFWYMPISKSQDKNSLHVVFWLPLRAGTSCQRSDCKSACWRCWP